MKKISNFTELEDLIDNDSVDGHFVENFKVIIKQAQKQSDLDNHCAVMSKEEMHRYINNIGRSELFEEIEDKNIKYPRFLKAIRVSLVAQGYDQCWVDSEFRTALEKKYLGK